MKFVFTVGSLIKALIYLMAFSITFYNIGISLGPIKVNIPLISILILDTILVFKEKFNSKNVLLLGLFFLICLMSGIIRHPFLSYFPSLSFTLALLLPLCVNWEKIGIEKERMLNYLVSGALLSILFIPFELYFRYMHLFGFEGNELWLNFGGHSLLFYRVSSTMSEPSHYMVVLSFIYILVDIAIKKGYQIKYIRLFKYGYFGALILSVSLSGIALILFYFLMKFIYFTLKCIENKVKLKISRRVIFGIIGGIVLLFIVNSFSNNLIGKIVSRVKDRVLVTKDLIREQKSIDSEGVRSSFIWVSKIYLTNSSEFNILLGEGYSNYQKWLRNNESKIGYKTGEVYNLFLALLLSIGVLGLIVFVILVINLADIDFRRGNDVIFLTTLFVSFLSHGYLIMYWVWLPILFFKIIKRDHNLI
jgi:hypothetical protein